MPPLLYSEERPLGAHWREDWMDSRVRLDAAPANDHLAYSLLINSNDNHHIKDAFKT
jgi:hypothetical protein